MNKTKMISNISEKTGLSKTAVTKVVDGFIAEITAGLKKGDVVRVAGLGKFEVRARKARTAVNPRTGKPMNITDLSVPAFRAGKPFIEKVNK